MGGGVFAGAEGRTCADLESGNGSIDCGDVPIVAGHEKPFPIRSWKGEEVRRVSLRIWPRWSF